MDIDTKINLLKKRRTKIVATLGPATQTPEMIRELILSGVNVFRLNMSHGNHDSHKQTFRDVRRISEDLESPVALLADLCGPKIRVGMFSNGTIHLRPDSYVTITTREVIGNDELIPSQYPGLSNDVHPGSRILIDDGAIELRVESVLDTEIKCKVVTGGQLREKKGINLPGVHVSAPSFTERDYDDARFMLELGVDFIALSFVRSAADLKPLKKLVHKLHRATRVIAKIEKPEALENASAIIKAADGIMIARGDLGVELNAELVPVAQGQLIELARSRFKPVIVATQMLESMIEHARPTRAEVTDISYAVTLGTDAVMLSAETAVGTYPLEAVGMMNRIIRQTEAHLWQAGAYGHFKPNARQKRHGIWEAISDVSAQFARELKVRCILVISNSGMSAATVCASRPSAPVIAITNQASTCRKMSLYWSVIPVLSRQAGRKNPNELAKEIAKALQLAEKGESILLMRGFHSSPDKNTPTVTVLTL